MYCTKCKSDKEELDFRIRGTMKRGRTSWCRECQNEDSRKRYIPRPKKIRDKKVYDPIGALKRQLKSRYSMTYDEYLLLYQKQDGTCAICGEHRTLGGKSGLYVDHDHKNGGVRGLLCPTCNSAIGKFKDDIMMMYRAIAYLSSSSESMYLCKK